MNGDFWRHKKRGTCYEEVGTAVLQTSKGPVNEDVLLVIYRAENGRLYARPQTEFHDGRFENMQIGVTYKTQIGTQEDEPT